jgi:FKBP-type peptidyl-prolyl cis-trans isomerase FkpA
MKSLKNISLITFATASLIGCSESGKVNLDKQEDKESYSIGASIGNYMSTNLEEQEKNGIKLNHDLIVKGFEQGLLNTQQLTKDEINETLQQLEMRYSEIRKDKAEKLAAENLKKGAEFLESNKSKEGITTTESGLQYEVLSTSEGKKPSKDDSVTVNFKGTLIDGTEFDSSYKNGQPITLSLSRVIPGWTEGVQLMSEGSKYKFYIPSELAFGEAGARNIPGNSTVIFEVELISIEKKEAEEKLATKAKKPN